PVKSAKTPDGEYKLAQLVRANMALSDYTQAFMVPCISGKDSMKNDSTRGGRKISIPPSLLFSMIAKMDDVTKSVTLDAKNAGDYVYVLGVTKPELGGSEYFAMLDAVGNNVPKVDAEAAKRLYSAVSAATGAELVNSLHTPALGGLGVGFARVAMAGRLGLKIDLGKLPQENCKSDIELLFSESNSRFIATVAPEKAAAFESALAGTVFARVGEVISDPVLEITGRDGEYVVTVEKLLEEYKKTLDQI
ncbi:MAG: AIR synthase-related protein, partial [Victivallaceae bacterium]|nr:AIR synthase-related protein [Victivallaceae bacterium]